MNQWVRLWKTRSTLFYYLSCDSTRFQSFVVIFYLLPFVVSLARIAVEQPRESQCSCGQPIVDETRIR